MTSQQISPPPRDFLCPITREIMQNPVLLIEDVSFLFFFERKNCCSKKKSRVAHMNYMPYNVGYAIIIHLQ